MSADKFWQKPVDFFARREHYLDHMLPVWNALRGERGKFYIPQCLAAYAEAKGVSDFIALTPYGAKEEEVSPDMSLSPMLVSSYGDMVVSHRRMPQRPFLFMEHGVGLTFKGSNAYAGGDGMRALVKLFLAPNEYIRKKTAVALPTAKQVVVGTPKLDRLSVTPTPWQRGIGQPVVVVSFHWDGSAIAPEAGNALRHYRDALPKLAGSKHFKLVGHGHPRYREVLKPLYESLGIEAVWSFERVLQIADVYVNDCSSTMYEFCATGKPVILLNAPWFRRDVKHGIRFWDYADIGPQVDEPEDLGTTIEAMLADPSMFFAERAEMVKELYPYLSHSAQRAAGAILGFLEAQRQ
ncbi:MAG: hypothetical protein DYG85_06410 [Chloroflexi bacterium CFX1]|nr:hypothetical protein [Chloroflexi bacterium CFX1]